MSWTQDISTGYKLPSGEWRGTHVRSCADNPDIRQLGSFGKPEHALDPFVGHSAADIAYDEYFVTFQEKTLSYASSGRVQVAEAW